MAIYTWLPGVEVAVAVKDEVLQEYTDPDLEEEDTSVTRYIEAQTGKTFELRFTNKKGSCRGAGLEFEVYVDGKEADNRLALTMDVLKGDYKAVSRGWYLGPGSQRRYKFARLQTGETLAKRKIDSGLIENLGSIQVNVYHLSECAQDEPTERLSKLAKRVATVGEQAVKGRALSHSISQGSLMEDKSTTYDTERFDEDPIAIFKFLYRSKEALKQEGIIPRTPSPPPLEERDFESLSRDDMREAFRRLKDLKDKEAERIKIKRENQDDSPMPKKKARLSEGSEVIELD